MLFRSMLCLAIFAPALFSTTGQAATTAELEELYLQLRNIPISYQVSGTVCEQIAVLRMQDEYPAKAFDVVSGIVYKGRDNYGSRRTLGELDVVVIRKSDREAIVVGEVKCWRKLGAARRKARSQLDRFAHYVGKGGNLTMHLVHNTKRHFKASQFDEQPKFIAISQDGGRQHGFHMTIGVSLDEAMDLRDRLLQWHVKHPPRNQQN